MKIRRIGKIAASIALFVLLGSTVLPKYALAVENGDSDVTPWLIDDCTELQAIGSGEGWDTDSYYQLNANIDCIGVDFEPIGSYVDAETNVAFTGHLYGNNKSIQNLVIDQAGTDYVGLFAYTVDAYIDNLTLASGSVTGDQEVGALIGRSEGMGLLDNVTSAMSVNGRESVGGLIGNLYNNVDEEVMADLTVTGDITVEQEGLAAAYIGGLIGYSGDYTIIDDGHFSGAFTVSSDVDVQYLGGLVGQGAGATRITNSDVETTISANGVAPGAFIRYAAGIIGYSSGDLVLDTVSLTGNVELTASSDVSYSGGLVGQTSSGLVITNSSVTGDFIPSSVDLDVSSVGGMVGYQEGQGTYVNSAYVGALEINADAEIDYVGGVVGWSGNSTTVFENVSVNGNITATSNTAYVEYLSGLMGYTYELGMTNSSYTGDILINASSYIYAIGGLVGWLEDRAVVAGSFVSGNITGVSDESYVNYVSGLIGYTDDELSLTSSAYVGNIDVSAFTSVDYVGGLVGYSYGYYKTSVINSYAEGDIMALSVTNGVTGLGGLIGYNSYNLYVDHSHYKGNIDVTSGESAYEIGGIAGAAYGEESIGITNSYFDGNITINAADYAYYVGGVTGYIYSEYEGIVSNVFVDGDITITTDTQDVYYVGGLVGYSGEGDPMDYISSHFEGDINVTAGANAYAIAGAVGYHYYAGNLDQVYAEGNLIVEAVGGFISEIGGLIGYSDDDMVMVNSYSQMNISTTAAQGIDSVGGLYGYNDGYDIVVASSYASGTLTVNAGDSVQDVGGVGGYNNTAAPVISNSFSAMTFDITSGTEDITTTGAFIGDIADTVFTNNYYDATLADGWLCAGETDPDPSGCIAEEDSEFFKNSSTGDLFGNWNFETVWQTNTDDYPTFIPSVIDEDETWTLGIAKTGSGSGVITSDPEGINCGTDCAQAFEDGETVTLTADASSGSRFNGWDGECVEEEGPVCVVEMDSDMSVVANFRRLASGGGSSGSSGSGSSSGTVTPPPVSPSNPPLLTYPEIVQTSPNLGQLVMDNSMNDATVYLIGSNKLKQPFTSSEAFLGLGFSFANIVKANLSGFVMGPAITTSNSSHPEGSLINDQGTIYLVLGNHKHGFTSEASFKSYGFSFNQVVPSNAYDLLLPTGNVMN